MFIIFKALYKGTDFHEPPSMKTAGFFLSPPDEILISLISLPSIVFPIVCSEQISGWEDAIWSRNSEIASNLKYAFQFIL